MDSGVFNCFQNLSHSLWKACPVGLRLILHRYECVPRAQKGQPDDKCES